MSMKSWEERTHLWGQINLTEDDPEVCDIAFWEKYWKESGTEGVIINAGGIVNYYRSENKEQYTPKSCEGIDYFGLWNDAARRNGLTVIARMDISCTDKSFYEKHSDWFCRDRIGQPIVTQGRYLTCVNGGYYTSYIPSVLREIIRKYHPDGFADNSWSGGGANTICYCENCRKQFREYSGEELPEEVNWELPSYRKWVRWNYLTRKRNWDYFNRITREEGGEDCRWFGMLSANPFSTGGKFYDIRALTENVHYVFLDQQSRDETHGFEMNAIFGDLIHQTAGENIPVTESMSHYYRGIRTFRLTCASREEVRKWMLSGIGGGISPWFHIVGGNTLDCRKTKLSKDIYQYLVGRRDLFENRTNDANIGVVWNQETPVYYGRDNSFYRSESCFLGIAETLSEAGIPFIPVHADDIEKYKERCDLLIFPNVTILTDQQEKMIADWMDSGKSLVLTDDTGLYDEDGEWKGPGLIYDKLGIRVTDEIVGSNGMDSADWKNDRSHSYFEIVNRKYDIENYFQDTDILPFGGTYRRTVLERPALVKALTYIPSFPIYPPEFSWIREYSDDGLLYMGTLESGSRVVYIPSDLDRCYKRFHIPDQRKMLENAILWACNENVSARVLTRHHIHINTWSCKRELFVSLINLVGGRCDVGTWEENIPLGPVEVFVSDQVFKADKVHAVTSELSGEQYSYRVVKNGIVVTVPGLEECDLIRLSPD
jgi:hypothetical protein